MNKNILIKAALIILGIILLITAGYFVFDFGQEEDNIAKDYANREERITASAVSQIATSSQENAQNQQQERTQDSELEDRPTVTTQKKRAAWKTYTNSDYGFTFQYPSNWTLYMQPAYGHTGGIILLRSPETVKLLQEGKIIASYSNDLIISFWSNINNDYTRGGSWDGHKVYANLIEFFADPNSFKQKIGNVTLSGQLGHEVIIGGHGANYAIMIERNGIYELSFERTYNKQDLGDT